MWRRSGKQPGRCCEGEKGIGGVGGRGGRYSRPASWGMVNSLGASAICISSWPASKSPFFKLQILPPTSEFLHCNFEGRHPENLDIISPAVDLVPGTRRRSRMSFKCRKEAKE